MSTTTSTTAPAAAPPAVSHASREPRESRESPLHLPEDDPFGPDNLPYGVFSRTTGPADGRAPRHVGVRYGAHVLDAGAMAAAVDSPHAPLLTASSLQPLLAAGPAVWRAVRRELRRWLTAPEHRATAEAHLLPLTEVRLHLPFAVADYVDFYASEHHAANVGRIFRPHTDPLPANWKHLPIGYHGRAGTVVVSGTPVVRPRGQRRPAPDADPEFGPTRQLDLEAEVGFVVGVPSEPGRPVPLDAFRDHVFGVCLVNDWSARDIQSFEYVPLGPFLGKSFATSVSAWITPLEALSAAWVAPPPRSHRPLPYLDDTDTTDGAPPAGLDLRLTVELNGVPVSHPPFAAMYWTAAQQLAHMTVNGAALRTGDLYASGTVSGPRREERGCLLELTWAGREPLRLPDGERAFLRDGDVVTIRGTAPGPHGVPLGLGEVTGRVLPAGA